MLCGHDVLSISCIYFNICEANVQLLTSAFFAPCRASGTPLSIHPTPPHTASHHCPYISDQGEICHILHIFEYKRFEMNVQ